MNCIRNLVLTVVPVIALMAFTTPASATTITSSDGTTPTIEAFSEGATTLDGILDVTCQKSSVKVPIQSHGTNVTAKGNITVLGFLECGGDHVTVVNKGALEVHATSGGNGTLTSSGAEITIEADTIFGIIHCIFSTSATDIGTITAGTNATLHLEGKKIPRTGGTGGFLCGSDAEWTGSWKVSTPSNLSVDS